jgi:hypothetical protein
MWQRSSFKHYASDWNVVGTNRDEVGGLSEYAHTCSHIMALRSTPAQSLTEMSTRHLPRGKGLPMSLVDNFIAICEPTV